VAAVLDQRLSRSAANPALSVVVCTHNGSAIVRGAIESLLAQTLDSTLYEVIVVDNASTDTTASVIAEFTECGKLHYVLETRPGLSHARNRGWRESRAEYVGFIDDDARADHAALEQALALLREPSHPVCVGGQILPFYTTPKPDWFKDAYETRNWGSRKRMLEFGESFSGSNMFWRREVLEAHGGFAADRGAVGSRLGVGDETSLFQAVWRQVADPRFLYSPEIVVHHWVPPMKMSPRYYARRALATGEDAIASSKASGRRVRLRGHLYRLVRDGVRSLVRIPRHRHWQTWLVEEGWSPLVSAGALIASAGVHFEFRRDDRPQLSDG
jgi:glucosyl-dolichyl phosphate glucuronosyltransferase